MDCSCVIFLIFWEGRDEVRCEEWYFCSDRANDVMLASKPRSEMGSLVTSYNLPPSCSSGTLSLRPSPGQQLLVEGGGGRYHKIISDFGKSRIILYEECEIHTNYDKFSVSIIFITKQCQLHILNGIMMTSCDIYINKLGIALNLSWQYNQGEQNQRWVRFKVGGTQSLSAWWFLQGERSVNVSGAARPRWQEKWLSRKESHFCRYWANVADR